MPRAFTADETSRIRARLLTEGARAFARRGLRGTTLDELTGAAGISKGAFYRFFDSKEALLLALLDERETAAHAEVEAAVRAEPASGIDLLVDAALHEVEHNPLLPVLMSEEGLRAIGSRPADEQRALLDRDARLVARVLAVLEDAGLELRVPHAVLLGLLRSLVFVGWHRGDIGGDLVDEVAAWLKQTLQAALRPTTRSVTP